MSSPTSTTASTPDGQPVATSLDEVVDLYDRWASSNYDESLSQIDHAVQTAAHAVDAGASDELVAAALLHDVGHLLDLAANDGHAGGSATPGAAADLHHEATGARYLAGLFGPKVTGPVALHVRAKRYRCGVDPAYLATLSEGSRRSLERQGGPADADEIRRFESNPGFADAVVLREWDDRGKVEGLEVPPFEHYRPLLERLVIGP